MREKENESSCLGSTYRDLCGALVTHAALYDVSIKCLELGIQNREKLGISVGWLSVGEWEGVSDSDDCQYQYQVVAVYLSFRVRFRSGTWKKCVTTCIPGEDATRNASSQTTDHQPYLAR
jgi:hypothetical protein